MRKGGTLGSQTKRNLEARDPRKEAAPIVISGASDLRNTIFCPTQRNAANGADGSNNIEGEPRPVEASELRKGASFNPADAVS
jgi:hypothetical protein